MDHLALVLLLGQYFLNLPYIICPIRFNGLPVSDERCGQFG